jgi:DNA-binding transcriptional ArsR family regulator
MLSQSQLGTAAALFKALGEPIRLQILQLLCAQPLYVSEIVRALGTTQPNASRHLAQLARAGAIQRQRDGQRVFYSLKGEWIPQLCKLVCSSMA